MRTLAQTIVNKRHIAIGQRGSTTVRTVDQSGAHFTSQMWASKPSFDSIVAFTKSTTFTPTDTLKTTLVNVVGSGCFNYIQLPRPASSANMNYELEVLVDGRRITINENVIAASVAPIIGFNIPMSGKVTTIRDTDHYRGGKQGLSFDSSLVVNLTCYPVYNQGDTNSMYASGFLNYYVDTDDFNTKMVIL